MKKIVSFFLSFVLLFCLAAGAFGEEAYPVHWDLTDLYADTAAWEADYEKELSLISGYEQFRGKLNNPQDIHDFIVFDQNSEMTDTFYKLVNYAQLGVTLDSVDPVFSRLYAKALEMESRLRMSKSFADPEIYALPLEERQRIFSDPIFDDMTYYVSKYTDPDRKQLNEDVELALATMNSVIDDNENIYATLLYSELPDPQITMPDGTVKDLDEGLYYEIMMSPDYDREFKCAAHELYYTATEPFQHTFAKLLEGSIQGQLALSRIKGYENVLAYSMSDEDIDPVIYDLVIACARKYLPEYQRFFRAARKLRGVDELYRFDMLTSGSDYNPELTSYEDGVALTENALSVLGEDYIRQYDDILRSGHMDVYEAENKEGGAADFYAALTVKPYIYLNYYGMVDDVNTIAHEMGHAMYDLLAIENQPGWNHYITLFTHEVASTTNELLFYEYMVKNAADPEEKLYYLENTLYNFSNAFFRQVLFSELEDYAVKLVEAGEGLNAEDLTRKMRELQAEYLGDAMTVSPAEGYYWAKLDHYYYSYYVYKYATSVVYAASIARRILAGEEGALEGYLNFLKAGRSAKPSELLTIAGVDPLKEETYESGMQYFEELLEEYEKMVDGTMGTVPFVPES